MPDIVFRSELFSPPRKNCFSSDSCFEDFGRYQQNNGIDEDFGSLFFIISALAEILLKSQTVYFFCSVQFLS